MNATARRVLADLTPVSSEWSKLRVIVARKHILVGSSALVLAFGVAGGAIAFAGGGGGDDQTMTGSNADQARAAALRATGGGAGIVEPESSYPDEHGAAYGVEITTPDGAKVDVFLDANFKLLRIASNEDG
jgi:hypothetical protein